MRWATRKLTYTAHRPGLSVRIALGPVGGSGRSAPPSRAGGANERGSHLEHHRIDQVEMVEFRGFGWLGWPGDRSVKVGELEIAQLLMTDHEPGFDDGQGRPVVHNWPVSIPELRVEHHSSQSDAASYRVINTAAVLLGGLREDHDQQDLAATRNDLPHNG